MSPTASLRTSTVLRNLFRRNPQQLRPQVPRRQYTAQTPPPRPPPPPASAQSRIERFNRRIPTFLHKYTNALASAPLSHITSFLILHEITAIVPLVGLAATFHYTHWLPSWFAEGAWVVSGVEKFGKYFKRRGWIRSEDAAEAEIEVELRKRDRAWGYGEGGVRLVVEFATAYAITKALLPLRIALSVWGTPWFARHTVLPAKNFVKRVFGRGKPKSGAVGSGAGTGAIEGGAVPKPGVGSKGTGV